MPTSGGTTGRPLTKSASPTQSEAAANVGSVAAWYRIGSNPGSQESTVPTKLVPASRVDDLLALHERVAEGDDRLGRADDLRDVPEHAAVRRRVEVVGGAVQKQSEPAAERRRAEPCQRERDAAQRQRCVPRARDDRRDDDDRREHSERSPQERRHSRGHDDEETERIPVEQRPPLERPSAGHETASADEPDERREREAQRGVQNDSDRDLGHGARCYPAGSELWSGTKPGTSAIGSSSSRRM